MPVREQLYTLGDKNKPIMRRYLVTLGNWWVSTREAKTNQRSIC